jgi:hypothetical protein
VSRPDPPLQATQGAAEVPRSARLARLDDARTEAALQALRRGELVTRGPEGVTRHSPGSVPF